MSGNENFDCIICGAGIGGLLTGAALSRAGLKVLVLEKTAIIGGRTHSIGKDGFKLSQGFHVIRYCKKSHTATIFKKLLGKREKLKFIELGQVKLFHNDEWFDYPLSASAIQNTTFFNDTEKEKFLQILQKEIIEANTETLFDNNVLDWINEVGEKYGIESGPTRIFLEVLSKYMQVSYGNLEKLSVGELIAGIQIGFKASAGACYPLDGWKLLIERLVNIIEENSEIRTETKVDKVLIENKKVMGVLVDGKRINAKIVVVNIPAQQIFSILDEMLFSASFVKKCKNLISSAGICLDFGLKKEISDIGGSIISTDPFTVSIFTSNVDPSAAPEGQQLYQLYRILSPEVFQDEKKLNEIIKETEDFIFKIFPNLSENILWKRVLKIPMVNAATTFVTQHRGNRPSVKSNDVEGLYFTGDSYNGPGTGGEIAHASAELCITTIMKDLNLEFEK